MFTEACNGCIVFSLSFPWYTHVLFTQSLLVHMHTLCCNFEDWDVWFGHQHVWEIPEWICSFCLAVVVIYFSLLLYFYFPFSYALCSLSCFSNPYDEFPLLILPYLLIELNFTPTSAISPFPVLGTHLKLKTWTKTLLDSCTQVLVPSWRLNIGLDWHINFITLKIGWHQSPLLLSGTWQSKTNPLSLSQ